MNNETAKTASTPVSSRDEATAASELLKDRRNLRAFFDGVSSEMMGVTNIVPPKAE